LAIGEIVLTLTEEDVALDPDFYQVHSCLISILHIQTIQSLVEKVPAYTKKSVHSNLVTLASLAFMQCMCASILPISPSTKQSYIAAIENALGKNVEVTQYKSSEALGAMSERFDLTPSVDKWLRNLQGKSTFTVRRGWAKAFGYLRSSKVNETLVALCDAIETDADVEVRRNALQSIKLICSREKVQGTRPLSVRNPDGDGDLSLRIWSAVIACLDDYSADSRGDVGSWIRMAACESLVPLFKTAPVDLGIVTIGKLLRLSVERMDRVRQAAGKTLHSIPANLLDVEVIRYLDGLEGDDSRTNG